MIIRCQDCNESQHDFISSNRSQVWYKMWQKIESRHHIFAAGTWVTLINLYTSGVTEKVIRHTISINAKDEMIVQAHTGPLYVVTTRTKGVPWSTAPFLHYGLGRPRIPKIPNMLSRPADGRLCWAVAAARVRLLGLLDFHPPPGYSLFVGCTGPHYIKTKPFNRPPLRQKKGFISFY